MRGLKSGVWNSGGECCRLGAVDGGLGFADWGLRGGIAEAFEGWGVGRWGLGELGDGSTGGWDGWGVGGLGGGRAEGPGVGAGDQGLGDVRAKRVEGWGLGWLVDGRMEAGSWG